MSRVLLGYYIRRSARDGEDFRGKTFCSYDHRLYPTRDMAARDLGEMRESRMLDARYEYDVAETWIDTDKENM